MSSVYGAMQPMVPTNISAVATITHGFIEPKLCRMVNVRVDSATQFMEGQVMHVEGASGHYSIIAIQDEHRMRLRRLFRVLPKYAVVEPPTLRCVVGAGNRMVPSGGYSDITIQKASRCPRGFAKAATYRIVGK